MLAFLLLICIRLTSAPSAHAETTKVANQQGFTVSGQHINASADAPFSGQVATISDPSATSSSQLNVTIDWGDGSSPSSGTVSGTGSSFNVSGSHTYNNSDPYNQNQFPLSYTITFSVTDTTTGQVSNGSGTATVNAELNVTGYSPLSPQVGVPYSVPVAYIYDPQATDPGKFSAMIDWGDGSSPSTGTISRDSTYFYVNGTHTYATLGAFITTITVTDTTSGQSGIGSGTASIGLSLDVSGYDFSFTATQNVPFSGEVAQVYDRGVTDPGQLSASIDWGDGSPRSAAIISSLNSAGNFSISGTHTYAIPGVFSTTISVIDTMTGRSGIGGGAVFDVGEFTVSGRNISATAGTQFSGQVATFTVNYNSGSFGASIDWGDGSPATSGTISRSGSVYTVSGSHTYAKGGTFTITTSVTDTSSAGQSNRGNGTASVTGSPVVQVSSQNISATAGTLFSGQVASVSDGAALGPGQLVVTITWGDGSPASPGTASGANGAFTISGSHTYAAAGNFPMTAIVTDTATGVTDSSLATATVAAPTAVQVSGQSITATAGTQFSGQVATVSDGAASQPGQLVATIDWGDGSPTSAGAVSGSGSSFTISGNHTYAKAGSFTITVSVTDTTTGAVGSGGSTATVSAPPLQVSGQTTTATAGVPVSGTVATVSDAAATGPGQFVATIDWGDGSPTSQGTGR